MAIVGIGVLSCLKLAAQAQPGSTELSIPGRFGGRGNPVYENTKFGKGIRVSNLCDRVFYPGCGTMREDQGTIEAWIKLLDDTEEGHGQQWRNILSTPPLDDQMGETYTQLNLCITQDSKEVFTPRSMRFSLRDQEAKGINSPTLSWAAGSEHVVTVTWGAKGLEIYLDGKLAASDPQAKGKFMGHFPARLIVGNHSVYGQLTGNLIVDELKISDIQRNADYVAKAAESILPPSLDESTLMLSHFNSSLEATGTLTEWKKGRAFTSIQTAWQSGLSPESGQGGVFLQSEPLVLHAFLSRFAPAAESLEVKYTIRDFHGKEVAAGSKPVSVPARCVDLDVPLPIAGNLAPGFYTAKLQLVTAKGETLGKSSQTFCLLEGDLPQGKMLWGFNVYDDYSTSFEAMKRMGIRLLRGHGVYFWTHIEPQKGGYRFAGAKGFAEKADRYGMKVLGVLGNTPAWGRVPPDNIQAFVGGRNYQSVLLDQDRYRPARIDDWSNYVTQTVTANSLVPYWEIWNEPDWHLPQTPGFGFGGTTEQYFELMKSGFAAVKKANPKARVVFPGIASASVADPDFVKDLLQGGALDYFNIAAMHAYGGDQFFKEQVDLFRKAGYQGPIWQSEYVPDAFISEPFPTRGKKIGLDQVRHIVKWLQFGLSAYVIHSTDIYFPHGQPIEGCFSTALLFRKLHDLAPIRMISSEAYVFGNRDRTVLVLWGASPIEVSTSASKLIVTDYMGFTKELEAQEGKVTLTPGEFVYVETAGAEKLDAEKLSVSAGLPGVLPENGSFEEYQGDAGMGNYTPLKWELSTFHRKGKMNLDLLQKKSGKASLVLEGPGSNTEGKIVVFQKLPALPKGRRYVLQAYLRVGKNSPEKGTAMVTVWDRDKSRLYASLALTQNMPEFTLLTAEFTLPDDAGSSLTLGCSVEGAIDRVWFDDIILKAR
ncbi:MAG: hypothetical protein B9S32_05750 [Verrucomicrobia bacterium Tous-C9LFEB]|nr:MAG: hypothetical protein B9S32_05750 [Verrucomicrobia bacterium Tous-C9LFEB]